MANLFPFFAEVEEVTEERALPIYREVAWDFRRNEPLIEYGEFKVQEGIEAIKTWCYKVLQVKRYSHLIYSWDYGNEIEALLGQLYSKNLAQAECIRYIEECLLINPYITGVSIIQSIFIEGTLKVDCKIDTVYGSAYLEEVKLNV